MNGKEKELLILLADTIENLYKEIGVDLYLMDTAIPMIREYAEGTISKAEVESFLDCFHKEHLGIISWCPTRGEVEMVIPDHILNVLVATKNALNVSIS